ncbi:MAG: hypothetical protein ABIR11_13835 [Candidatus Limnocylindrales bacterium]
MDDSPQDPRAWTVVGLRALLVRPIVSAALLALAIVLVVVPWLIAVRINLPYVQWLAGIDADIYFSATRRWLTDGTWWLPRQLTGPYGIQYGDVLYPPVLLYLTVPFQALPFAAWWAAPFAVTAWALWRIAPPRWSWPLLVLCLAWPLTVEEVIKGNPVIWVLALESASLALGLPTTLVLLKPSLFPFALIGIHRRSWWLLLAAMAVASLPFLTLTLQYPQVILDSRGGGLLYSVRDIPLVLLPVIAALASGTLRPRLWMQLSVRTRSGFR